MLQVILFDVDGVLANGEAFSKHLARDHGLSREMTAPFFRGPFIECLTGRADLKQLLGSYLQPWGWQSSVDEFLAYWFQAEHCIDEQLMHSVAQFRRQGIRCYVATNQEKYRTAYILEKMGFAEAFDGMFSSAYIGCMKHDLAFFSHVLSSLGDVPAQNILFWDDSLINVATAREVGLHAEVYQNFTDFNQKMFYYLDGTSLKSMPHDR